MVQSAFTEKSQESTKSILINIIENYIKGLIFYFFLKTKKYCFEDHKHQCKEALKQCKGCDTTFKQKISTSIVAPSNLEKKLTTIRKENMDIKLKLLRSLVENRVKLATNLTEITALKDANEEKKRRYFKKRLKTKNIMKKSMNALINAYFSTYSSKLVSQMVRWHFSFS